MHIGREPDYYSDFVFFFRKTTELTSNRSTFCTIKSERKFAHKIAIFHNKQVLRITGDRYTSSKGSPLGNFSAL